MKSFIAAMLVLASSAAAQNLPTVQAAVAQWTNDVATVNNFLNLIAFSGQPATDAANLLPTVLDEPNQLSALNGLLTPGDANGGNAFTVLSNNFPTVVAAVTNIQNSGNQPDVVKANVAVINAIRCGVVLKNIGTLFEASLLDNGATGFNFPPGPNVCPAPDANGNYAVVAPLL